MLISFSGAIPHRVSEWNIPQGPHDLPQGLTPGRISTVMFFPENSLALLEGKPPRWGIDTAYGTHFRQ